MVNATGWSQLMNGKMLSASFLMYNTSFDGWIIALLFLIFQFMLWLKTRNVTLSWVVGLLFLSFLSVFYKTKEALVPIINNTSQIIIFVILIIELGAILFMFFWKDDKG